LELKIKEPNNYYYNNDEYIKHLQEKDNWLCLYPIIVSQRNGYSDNFNMIRNYQDITMKPKLFKDENIKRIKDIMDNKIDESKNIEGIIEETVEEQETIEVPEELLKNLRNIIEVANGRIQWKIEELLPVGLIIKQLDELLK